MLFGTRADQIQKKGRVQNRPPLISKFESSDPIVSTCLGFHEYCEQKHRRTVSLTVNATDPDNDLLTYSYSPTGGEIFGEGASVSWKLGDQPYATYSNTVTVTDSKGASSSATLKVSVTRCEHCGIWDPPCPSVAVFGGEEVTYRGELLSFHAKVDEGYFESRPDYLWTVSGGKILKGQHTPWIQVEANGGVGGEVRAIVEVEGFDASCSKRASQSVRIKQ
jgi:hypothetical protein